MANVAPWILEASPPYPDGDLLEGGVAIISLSARQGARLICICAAELQGVTGQCNVYWSDIKYALTDRADSVKVQDQLGYAHISAALIWQEQRMP